MDFRRFCKVLVNDLIMNPTDGELLFYMVNSSRFRQLIRKRSEWDRDFCKKIVDGVYKISKTPSDVLKVAILLQLEVFSIEAISKIKEKGYDFEHIMLMEFLIDKPLHRYMYNFLKHISTVPALKEYVVTGLLGEANELLDAYSIQYIRDMKKFLFFDLDATSKALYFISRFLQVFSPIQYNGDLISRFEMYIQAIKDMETNPSRRTLRQIDSLETSYEIFVDAVQEKNLWSKLKTAVSKNKFDKFKWDGPCRKTLETPQDIQALRTYARNLANVDENDVLNMRKAELCRVLNTLPNRPFQKDAVECDDSEVDPITFDNIPVYRRVRFDGKQCFDVKSLYGNHIARGFENNPNTMEDFPREFVKEVRDIYNKVTEMEVKGFKDEFHFMDPLPLTKTEIMTYMQDKKELLGHTLDQLLVANDRQLIDIYSAILQIHNVPNSQESIQRFSQSKYKKEDLIRFIKLLLNQNNDVMDRKIVDVLETVLGIKTPVTPDVPSDSTPFQQLPNTPAITSYQPIQRPLGFRWLPEQTTPPEPLPGSWIGGRRRSMVSRRRRSKVSRRRSKVSRRKRSKVSKRKNTSRRRKRSVYRRVA